MAYFAKTPIQHGLDSGDVVTLQVGDELTEEHGFSQNDIDTLLASDSIEEGDEYSGERPVGPMERVTTAHGVEGQTLPSGAPETPQEAAEADAVATEPSLEEDTDAEGVDERTEDTENRE